VDINSLALALDDGVEQGVLPDEGDRQAVEVRTARTWLFLLGYLRRNNESGTPDRDFLDGLNAFRVEAGFESVQDGLTAKTLSRLKRLVCFDSSVAVEGSDLGANRRFDGTSLQSLSAVKAIALRLYALDILDTPPKFGEAEDKLFERMRAGVVEFAHVYSLLGLGSIPSTAETHTITAMFDFEPILEELRGSARSTVILHPAGSSARQKKRNREAVKKFVRALARIELWLVGYLARPRKQMWPRDNSNRSLPSALRAFWRDQPEQVRPPTRELEHIDGRFFERLRDILLQDQDSDALENERLQSELMKNGELAGAVKRETRNLGAWLLDGIKRAARFIFGWVRKGLRKIVALARNVASLLTRRVRSVFDSVRQIVYALRDSWKFIFHNPVPGSDIDHLLVMHDKDFDFLLLRNPEAETDAVTTTGRRVGLMARQMAASWKFVGHLLDALIRLARRSGIGGWFGVLLVLAKARQWVIEVRETLVELRAVRAELDALPAVT